MRAAPTTFSIALRMVVPGVMSPRRPRQPTDQPPHWMPMLSARRPQTWTRAVFFSGSVCLSFFSTTRLLRTASRATSRWAGEPISRGQRAIRERLLPQLEAHLLLQDAADGVVDARLLHAAGRDQRLQARDEVAVRVRHHDHVDAGVDRDVDRLAVVAGRHPIDRLPVADDEAAERELALQHVGDQVLVAVHELTVPARVRHHHAADAGLHGGDVAGQVEPPQLVFGDARVALVLAALRAAVGQEVLRGREDRRAVGRLLEAADGGGAQARDQLGVLAVALVGAAPALVARDRETGREVPVDAGGRDLARGHARRRLDERGIVRGAHADVVREDRRALDGAVAVDGVDAVEHRDPEACRERLALVGGRTSRSRSPVRSAWAASRRPTARSRAGSRGPPCRPAAPSCRPGSSGRSSRRWSSATAAPRRRAIGRRLFGRLEQWRRSASASRLAAAGCRSRAWSATRPRRRRPCPEIDAGSEKARAERSRRSLLTRTNDV